MLPGRGTAGYVVAGLAAAVAFLASLPAHEMAHAPVARRNGVEVDGSTNARGGVPHRRGRAADQPAARVVLGGLALLARASGADGLPVAVLDYLAAGGGADVVRVPRP